MRHTSTLPGTPALQLVLTSVFDQYGEPAGSPTDRSNHDPTDWEQVHFRLNGPTRRGIFPKVFGWFGEEDVNVDSGSVRILHGVNGIPYATYSGDYLLSARPEAMARVKRGLQAKTRELARDINRQDGDDLEAPPIHYQLSLFAESRTGIVGTVTGAVESRGGKIVGLFCQTLPGAAAAEVGEPVVGLFRLHMNVDIPRAYATDASASIREGLNELGASAGWAVRFVETLTVARVRRALSGIAGCDDLTAPMTDRAQEGEQS